MNELEKTARYWLEKGIATLPIRYKSKSPEVYSWSAYTERLPIPEEIERWYTTPYHNIGVITGWRNLCILDFDNFARYEGWCDWAEQESVIAYTVLQTSRIVFSARGVHLYLYTHEKARNYKLDALDVLCDRKYALTAPSIHPTGLQYVVMQDREPARIARVEDMIPPEWIRSAEEKLMRQAVMQPASEAEDTPTAGIVAKIKQHWRIETFFPEYIPSGSGWCKVRCPLHDDQHPSAGINLDKQIFVCFNHCYGTKPLDVIGLYARIRGISNKEAIAEMAKAI